MRGHRQMQRILELGSKRRHKRHYAKNDYILRAPNRIARSSHAKMPEKNDNTKANSKGCRHFSTRNTGTTYQLLRNMICCNRKPGGPKYGRLKVTLPNGQKNVLLANRFAYMPNLPAELHVSHKCHGFFCIKLMHYTFLLNQSMYVPP